MDSETRLGSARTSSAGQKPADRRAASADQEVITIIFSLSVNILREASAHAYI